MTVSETSYSRVVVIKSVDRDQPDIVNELRSDRLAAPTIGAALDAYAPDPAPGARWIVEYLGRARNVG
jgi:hypothetical protein